MNMLVPTMSESVLLSQAKLAVPEVTTISCHAVSWWLKLKMEDEEVLCGTDVSTSTEPRWYALSNRAANLSAAPRFQRPLEKRLALQGYLVTALKSETSPCART